MTETLYREDKNKYWSNFKIWAYKQGHNYDIMTYFVK